MLRQALTERVKPVLFLNKLDRVITELHTEAEDAYQIFNKVIESVNVVIDTYRDPFLGDVQVAPTDGTVGFGAAKMGWAFTLPVMARIYSAKFGMPPEKIIGKMWGDNFIDPKTNKWSNKGTGADGKPIPRGFSHFCFKPIVTLFEAVANQDMKKLDVLVQKLGITVPADAKDVQGTYKLKRIMQSWIPAHEALLGMICVHLPSPALAQRYRCACACFSFFCPFFCLLVLSSSLWFLYLLFPVA